MVSPECHSALEVIDYGRHRDVLLYVDPRTYDLRVTVRESRGVAGAHNGHARRSGLGAPAASNARAPARQASCSGSIANRRVLRLPVPGRLARRPLRGLRHAGPLGQRAPGPESKYAAASAITAASAPAGSAGSGRRLSRRPRRAGNDRRIRPTPAAVSRRCPRLSAFQAPVASRSREPASESSCSVFARG
jgi:hypothetical protein